MNYLPPSDEQAWLLEKLKELIRHRGKKTFLRAPLVEATDAFFPDRWSPDPAGVRRLILRVMRYAEMKSHRIALEVFEGDPRPVFGNTGRVHGFEHESDTVAWFAGMDDDGTCNFGVRKDHLDQQGALAAILCHEVAHAYRARHGLGYSTHEEEESLTDLTTVYLGFGLLTANLASWRRSKAHPEYLTQQAFSFLLAAQVVSRGMDGAVRKAVARQLDANQAAFFVAACEDLESREVAVLLGLGKSTKAKRDATARSFNRGLAVHRIRGGWFRRPRCSDEGCRAVLLPSDEICPGCMGTVMGEAASRADAAKRERSLVESEESAATDVLATLKRDDPP